MLKAPIGDYQPMKITDSRCVDPCRVRWKSSDLYRSVRNKPV